MALSKDQEFDSTGIKCSYWRISSINAQYNIDGAISIEAIIGGYTTKEIRNEMKNSIDSLRISVPAEAYDQYFATGITRLSLYKFLKEYESIDNPFFGAVDA